METDALLSEQIAYYRARAPEYDNWWHRQEQYALEPAVREIWEAEQRELSRLVDGWVRDIAEPRRVLEIACGTGIWTQHLAQLADEVVAVDASPEVIERARGKLPRGAAVTFIEDDVFSFEPEENAFDIVFFSFWLSHVPPDKFDAFWRMVRRTLRPGGRALVIDNRWNDGVWPPGSRPRPTDHVQVRTDLSSGDAYRIVKVYFEPDELVERLAALGWRSEATATGRFFVAGWATPVDE